MAQHGSSKPRRYAWPGVGVTMAFQSSAHAIKFYEILFTPDSRDISQHKSFKQYTSHPSYL